MSKTRKPDSPLIKGSGLHRFYGGSGGVHTAFAGSGP